GHYHHRRAVAEPDPDPVYDTGRLPLPGPPAVAFCAPPGEEGGGGRGRPDDMIITMHPSNFFIAQPAGQAASSTRGGAALAHRTPRLRALAGACLAALALAGCAVGPDYRQPGIDVGAAYRQAAAELEPTANAGWVQVDHGAEDALRADWWTLYGDAGLDALMAELQTGNLDIRLAEARYRQAQAALQSARSGFFPTVGSNASVERSGSGGGTATGSGGGASGFGGGSSNSYALSGSVSW